MFLFIGVLFSIFAVMLPPVSGDSMEAQADVEWSIEVFPDSWLCEEQTRHWAAFNGTSSSTKKTCLNLGRSITDHTLRINPGLCKFTFFRVADCPGDEDPTYYSIPQDSEDALMEIKEKESGINELFQERYHPQAILRPENAGDCIELRLTQFSLPKPKVVEFKTEWYTDDTLSDRTHLVRINRAALVPEWGHLWAKRDLGDRVPKEETGWPGEPKKDPFEQGYYRPKWIAALHKSIDELYDRYLNSFVVKEQDPTNPKQNPLVSQAIYNQQVREVDVKRAASHRYIERVAKRELNPSVLIECRALW